MVVNYLAIVLNGNDDKIAEIEAMFKANFPGVVVHTGEIEEPNEHGHSFFVLLDTPIISFTANKIFEIVQALFPVEICLLQLMFQSRQSEATII